MADDPVVAVGLMTARDLEVLGSGFRRYFTVSDEEQFQELLDAIDRADAAARERAGARE